MENIRKKKLVLGEIHTPDLDDYNKAISKYNISNTVLSISF